MFKYWLKNRFIVETLTFILSLTVNTIFFFSNSVSNLSLSYDAISLYKELNIDFNVPSPGKLQIQDLENLTHIDDVIPYYSTSKTVAFGLESLANVNVLFFDNFNQNDLTMYNEARLIETASRQFENPLIVDFRFINQTGLAIEDEVIIEFGNIYTTFNIQSIYETNTYYNTNVVLGLWKGSQKNNTELFLGKPLGFSGAYINSNNLTATQLFLQNEYKPLGRLRERSEFDTEESYQIHYDNFYSTNYSNEISNFDNLFIDKSIRSNNYLLISYTNLYVGLLILILLQAFFTINFISRKSEFKYFKTLINIGKNPKPYFFYSLLIEGVFSIIFSFLLFNYLFINLNSYLPLQLKFSLFAPILIGLIIYHLVVFVISNRFISKSNK